VNEAEYGPVAAVTMTGYSALGARWGLLLTTMMLGAVLVVTGVTNYLDARTTGAAMTRVEANDFLALRHAIRDAGTFAPPVLERLLADGESRGARYIAVVAPEGVLAAAGARGTERKPATRPAVPRR
jgi:hypothetical protein